MCKTIPGREMARRCFPPRGEFTNKSEVLSTRIGPTHEPRWKTRQRQASGRSAKRSNSACAAASVKTRTIAERFGDRRTYRLFQLAADVANALWNPDKQEADWLDDPSLFDVVAVAINGVLQAVRPPGAKAELSWIAREALERRPAGVLAATFAAIQAADPTALFDPKAQGWRAEAASRKADLGEIAMRPKIERRPTRPGHGSIHLAGSPDRIPSKPKRKGRNSERTHPPPRQGPGS